MLLGQSNAVGNCLNKRSMEGIGELGVYQICGMGGDTVAENWFGSKWRSSWKRVALEPQKPVIGILAFEVSRMMSKVVNIWHCIGEHQIVRLREEIVNSVGIKKLVSQDNNYLMDLVLAETTDNLVSVAKLIALLGKKCVDPIYHNLEHVFDDPAEMDPKWIWWQYRLKKMERKVKKMEKFVTRTEQLYNELEVLAELHQNLRQTRVGADIDKLKFFELQRKILLQRLEVKNLQAMSPWVRTYDYIVRLLLRSLFTIVDRMKHLCRNFAGFNDDQHPIGDLFGRSNSMSHHIRLSLYTSENKLFRSYSGLGQSQEKSRSRNNTQSIAGRLAANGFKGQIPGEQSYTPSSSDTLGSNNTSDKEIDATNAIPIRDSVASAKQSFFHLKRNLLNAPPSTLGYAALALHYANVILVIKKLASAPHSISDDLREYLYNMLPTSIRNRLGAKLRGFSGPSVSLTYDAASAEEWKLKVSRILNWLSPLALNTTRWHSDLSFERRRMVFGSNVLLVQTLHFAKQVKTEAAIIQLFVGLNYLSRFPKEIKEKTSGNLSCSRQCDDGSILTEDKTCYDMIDATSL